MKSYQETFNTWNKIAKIYEEKFLNFDLYNDTYDFMIDRIAKRDAKILDIACGPGNITKYLLSKNPLFQIKGIDIAENMIHLARKNNPKAEFEVMDCREVSKIMEKFDAITCGFCLPFLSQNDLSKLFNDCNHLLSNMGLIYLSFMDGDYQKSGFQSSANGDRVYFCFHNKKNVKRQLTINSFQVIEEFTKIYVDANKIKSEHNIIIAQKIRK